MSRKEEPSVISYKEAIKARWISSDNQLCSLVLLVPPRQGSKARRRPEEEQEAQPQQFSLQYIRPERKVSVLLV